MESVEQNLELVNKWVEIGIEFSVKYGFQLLGGLLFFLFGFIVANWIGNHLEKLAISKKIDQTLSHFLGSTAKFVLVILLIIITLGNFGISIAPLIALAGAITFGATLALQGPLSNFGSGISIIITRPFVIGNVIAVHGVSGIVEKITMGVTVLTGEDGEHITIPNKEIVGQVIVNSHETRILEIEFCIQADVDTETVIKSLQSALQKLPELSAEPAAQIGIQDFTYGGVLIGVRAWVSGSQYFQVRYAVNTLILSYLKTQNIPLYMPAVSALPRPTPITTALSSSNSNPASPL
ncbi:MAG: mechanosensitive ion channel family protein [Sneathiella sp.]